MPIDMVIGQIYKLFYLSEQEQQQKSLNREIKNIDNNKIEVVGNIQIFFQSNDM